MNLHLKMINTAVILSLFLFTIPTALSEFTSSNITCALCLIGANEIEAITDYGLDEELMVGYLIQVRLSLRIISSHVISFPWCICSKNLEI